MHVNSYHSIIFQNLAQLQPVFLVKTLILVLALLFDPPCQQDLIQDVEGQTRTDEGAIDTCFKLLANQLISLCLQAERDRARGYGAGGPAETTGQVQGGARMGMGAETGAVTGLPPQQQVPAPQMQQGGYG